MATKDKVPMLTRTEALVDKWFRTSLTPDPVLTVSQWADAKRVLSQKASSEFGQWRTERTPYLREIMDVLSINHPCKKVVFQKASQVGGTEAGNNWLGYIIDHAPAPTMLVLPDLASIKRNSKIRINPLIEETPSLAAKVSTSKSGDSANTTSMKEFDGGVLVLATAASASALKSLPAKNVMLDELDEMPDDVEGQGSPISLVMARSRTFSRRKAFLVSTPTVEGLSKIADEFKQSDQRHFYIPCPHCNEYQTLEFANLSWPGKDSSEPSRTKEAAFYCVKCGEEIQERFKDKFLSRGEWRAHNPGAETIGFFLNSFYSPIGWLSWGDIAFEYEEAKKEFETEKKTDKLKAFRNTIEGLTWDEPGEAPDWKRLYVRRENFPERIVPKEAVVLTAAADVQKDRIEIEVVAWAPGYENWSIDYHVLEGDPDKVEVWNALQDYIAQTFPVEGKHEDEEGMPLRIVGIDSGFKTQMVYAFCAKFAGNKVVALRGLDNQAQIVAQPKITDVKLKGKLTRRRAAKVWNVGTTVIKEELYGWLKAETPVDGAKVPRGYSHFPQYAEEYFRQLTAEKLVHRRNSKGKVIREFVKDRERNEALDVRVYNRAVLALAGYDRKKWFTASTGPVNESGVSEPEGGPAPAATMKESAAPDVSPSVANEKESPHSVLAPIRRVTKRPGRVARPRRTSEIW